MPVPDLSTDQHHCTRGDEAASVLLQSLLERAMGRLCGVLSA